MENGRLRDLSLRKKRHRRRVWLDQRNSPQDEAFAPLNGGQNSDLPESVLEYHQLRHRQIRRLEAPVDDLKEFFGQSAEHLVQVSWTLHPSDFLMAQWAVQAQLEGWTLAGERHYWDDRPTLLNRQAVEVSHDRFEFVLKEGRQFWRGPAGERVVIDLDYEAGYMPRESEVTFVIEESRHQWALDLIPKMKEWMDGNHYLGGQAITARGDFIDFDEPTEWKDVLLPDELRESIERNCIDLLKYSELYKANGIPLRRGLLLHGKPGTGKTMIGRALAQQCQVTFILATPGMIDDPSDVRRVFSWGHRFAPSILFFEDFDMVASDRHMNAHPDILGEFLVGLDGLDAREGIIAIATTNDLTAIEPALKERPNRFDLVLEIPTMGERERHQYLENWREARPGSEIDTEELARRSHGFTGAQMQELCRLAVFEAVEEHLKHGSGDAKRLPLKTAHFEHALSRCGGAPKKTIGYTA